jgi:hypothetical protein
MKTTVLASFIGGLFARERSNDVGGLDHLTSSLTLYCPQVDDLTAAYGSPSIYNQGWSIHAGGAAATKASYNLLGGYVEYDIDFSGVRPGVNSNIYAITPSGISSSGFIQNNYCDSQTGPNWCLEVDWVESNGNCGKF